MCIFYFKNSFVFLPIERLTTLFWAFSAGVSVTIVQRVLWVRGNADKLGEVTGIPVERS